MLNPDDFEEFEQIDCFFDRNVRHIDRETFVEFTKGMFADVATAEEYLLYACSIWLGPYGQTFALSKDRQEVWQAFTMLARPDWNDKQFRGYKGQGGRISWGREYQLISDDHFQFDRLVDDEPSATYVMLKASTYVKVETKSTIQLFSVEVSYLGYCRRLLLTDSYDYALQEYRNLARGES